jgi:ATP-dependent 26S proteasome regulatory subunit
LSDTISTDSAYLFNALQDIMQALEKYLRKKEVTPSPASSKEPGKFFALDRLVHKLKLSEFEKYVLLLCAGTELDSDFGKLIGELQGNVKLVHPSFSLVLKVFPGSKLDALAPTSALRSWNLVQINNGIRKITSPLEIDEHILYYLLGIENLHPDLAGMISPIRRLGLISESQEQVLEQIIALIDKSAALPVIHLVGDDVQDIQTLAVAASRYAGHYLYHLSPSMIPSDSHGRRKLLLLWNREARLKNYLLLIDCSSLHEGDKGTIQNVLHMVSGLEKGFLVNFPEKVMALETDYPRFEVKNPSKGEQYQLWQDNLPASFTAIDEITSQFDLSTSKISTITANFSEVGLEEDIKELVWQSCCAATRPKLDELAQRIELKASWEDIVLPDDQMQILKEIVGQVKNRYKVYHEWGFENKSNRGLGISALFSGASGTGKTMAAEVLANALNLDLYQIDLSQVVNKYIGETEKNLKRIFDSAESSGAVVSFDEGDALFGKRKEVTDQVSSFNNIEVSYLLQRIEQFKGLTILTTNMKSAIDKAFFRRIRFILHFKQPTIALRQEMWKKAFPRPLENTPSIIGKLDYARLAQLNVTGGNIKNIALNAAFLAAAREGGVVEMEDILKATQLEYRKLERTLSRSEIKDWLGSSIEL